MQDCLHSLGSNLMLSSKSVFTIAPEKEIPTLQVLAAVPSINSSVILGG